jgi:hypothetical protein
VTADRLDPAVIAEWARRSRASQGLPERITDGAVLTKVITLAFAGTGPLANDSAPGGGKPRRRPDRSEAASSGRGRARHATPA